ncbi:hypothetical protein L1987_49988 [Smallanthus sonchifolius]|uniref:Uncharacterized protein n=1 Tax=Smallanthus sonchifolius TaxID=185202 RepID=A0ACB9FVZ9_9ASTR|nr:hypothetical protein L1987_49988 [Smallanthus sonchifolius]
MMCLRRPWTIKEYLDIEKKNVDERFNKIEKDIKKLKRGTDNVSEAGSCQMGGYEEDFEDQPLEESLDNLCYLAVDVASNIVAKGAILKYSVSGENIEVMMEICVQSEASLPIPLEDEFIFKRMKMKKKQPREPEKENAKKDDEIMENKKEKVEEKENGKENAKKDDEIMENKKRESRRKREWKRECKEGWRELKKSVILKMTAMMVDGQVSKVDSIKVQCEDDLFGYESYTYLTWDDFQAVFTLEELTGVVITSYMMYLFEQIKNGSKRDHGFCFVSPTASSPRERKAKSKNIDDSSRSVAERLSKRNDNDIILIPYNPGFDYQNHLN